MKQIKGIKILKQNKGAALVWALIALVVLSILVGSTAFISRQNIFEMAKQEERLQTYYIALAGVELTYAALMEINGTDMDINQSIINKIENSAAAGQEIKQDIDVITGGEERGTATVTIKMTEQEIEDQNKTIDWVTITSIGKLKEELNANKL